MTNLALTGKLIQAFLALEETKRFAIAAQRCHVSASAFSQMITRLEDTVGARLFDRDTRNVSLTPEGEAFSSGAHRIAAEMQASIVDMSERAQLRRGRICVAAPPSLAAGWLPGIMASFRTEHPNIDLRLHDVVSDHCLAMVSDGIVDFGLNAQGGNSLEFDTHLLFLERMYLVCKEADPLAKLEHIRLTDIANRDYIHTVRSGSIWQHMLPWLSASNIRDSGLEVTQLGTLAGLILNDFGISIVPQFALSLCMHPGLVARPLKPKKTARPIYAIRRRDYSLSLAAQSLWDKINQQALLVNAHPH